MFRDFVVLLSIVSVMDFWSYIPFLEGRLGMLGWLINTFLLVYYIFVILIKRKVRYSYERIDKIVVWTIITILLGVFPACISYGQEYGESIMACLRLSLGLFLYLVLRRWDYPVHSLIKEITFVSVIWVCLEIGQQFTYPNFWFSGRYVGYNSIDIRMGLYRYYIWGVDFVMIALAYWCLKFFSSMGTCQKKGYFFILFALLAVGILCYCSRKHIYAFLLLMAIPILKLRGKQRRIAFGIIFIALGVLFFNFFDDFSAMNKESVSSQEDDNGEFVRFVSARFFLTEFSHDFSYYLFGMGLETNGSRLHRILESLATLRIYQADVGIIGYFSKFGLLGTSAIIWYIVEFVKRRNYIDSWLIGFFVMKMVLVIFDFWAIWDVGMAAYALFLYILHRNINKNMIQQKKIIKE